MYDRQKVIDIALSEVGYLEKRSNSGLDSKTDNAGYNNWTKYARDLANAGYYNGNKNGYAWCDVFVDWCFFKAWGKDIGQKLQCQTGSLGAGCTYSAQYYANQGRLFKTPQPGDQIFFGVKDDVYHTGLVYAVDSKRVYTVEGNTSGGSDVVANGGGVFKKAYSLDNVEIYRYGRPLYGDNIHNAATEQNYVPTVLEWQKAAIADGFRFPRYGADGIWGAECENIATNAIVMERGVYLYPNLTKIVQKALGVEDVDGKCGPITDNAIRKYQMKHGLVVDGECGINTWKKILDI